MFTPDRLAMPKFYFYETRTRAFVFTRHYEGSIDAVRAAYDVNKLTGKLTCMVSALPPKLLAKTDSKVIFIRRTGEISLAG